MSHSAGHRKQAARKCFAKIQNREEQTFALFPSSLNFVSFAAISSHQRALFCKSNVNNASYWLQLLCVKCNLIEVCLIDQTPPYAADSTCGCIFSIYLSSFLVMRTTNEAEYQLTVVTGWLHFCFCVWELRAAHR